MSITRQPDAPLEGAPGTAARPESAGGALVGAVPPPASPELLVAGTLALMGALRARRRVSAAR